MFMKFIDNFKKNKFNKEEIDSVLSTARNDNKKFLYDVLSIKNASLFDVTYIMAHLHLDEERIQFIKLAIENYDKNEKINKGSYNMFLYELIRNVEKLENGNLEIMEEIRACRKQITSFKSFLDYLVIKSVLPEAKFRRNFRFSKIYIDN